MSVASSALEKTPELPRPARVLELTPRFGLDLPDALAGPFSARLLSQRPQVRAAALPITVIAARYDGSPSVTIEAGRP